MAKPEVLIIEDSPSLALGYAAQLEEAGYAITVAGTLAEAREALRGSSYAAALLDLQLPDGDGLSLLEKRNDNSPAFIVITSDGSLSRAIAAMRVGAFDFLVKPVAGTRLLATTRAAVDQAKVSGAKKDRTKTSDKTSFHGFIGQSPVMQQVYRTIEQVADSRASVFVTGESGTGKEVTAEALHAASSRNRGAFVAINCGAIPENLLESELFGHVKGAFTGAVENRIGAAKAADGGTLFLDEICEMDLKLQVKLLRFLQTGMIQRVGSSRAEPVDVRIVCATNRDPMREVAEGRFREDLLYRLNVIPIHLPALRERGDDILLLADRLTATIGKEEGRPEVQLSVSSRSRILGHSWPGNVRELQNALRRAVVTAADSQIEIAIANPRAAAATFEVGPEPWASSAPAGPEPTAPNAQPTGEPSFEGMTLAEIERMAIEAAIRRTNGNITKAAKNLGVNPSTIYRKLEKWAAQADDPRFADP
ncbi:sigma-54 dependent transcriptional regulator [Qipengyuania aquimaris]|uniref:sigma-54-dependent transcriptional regulator n=1 Tax=Qipengyuania aquimaris TaxID=255984 RepID=UPI001C986586|nr:sigma-54 dependent transcriptional regulator [Qipengyuania aquimaris]MBY6127765.1 sigma-54 dependent transcriptional regulator [Qipengyuania aquimaris]